MLQPFQPTMGATVTVNASTTSARVALGGGPAPAGTKYQYRIVNPGASVAYVCFGDKTVAATATDVPILPGAREIFTYTVPDGVTDGLYLAALLASGTATISITTGVGIA